MALARLLLRVAQDVDVTRDAKRVEQMRRWRQRGWTYSRIARRYGISRQRVHQILNGQAK